MKKTYLTLLLLTISFVHLNAQETKSFFIGAGGSMTSFQDTKYSDVRYNGIGGMFELGYQKENIKSLHGIRFQGTFSNESPSTHSATTAKTMDYMLQAKYLHKVKENLFIGATWDILDFYRKNFSGLGNNGSYDVVGSSLWASGMYNYKKFRFGLDLGLVSYFREGTGFGFSAPQNVLEDGNFDYQDEAITNPLSFKYNKVRTIPKDFQIRTNIRYQLSNRFSVGYQWHLRKFSEIKNRPVTYGIHALSVRYNLFNRTK